MTNRVYVWFVFVGTDGKSKSSKSVKLREDWRQRSKPIPPGGTYPAKDHCSQCGLCDTYYIAHVKDACAFLGDGMSKIEVCFLIIDPFYSTISFNHKFPLSIIPHLD
jgi:hypothetical protein